MYISKTLINFTSQTIYHFSNFKNFVVSYFEISFQKKFPSYLNNSRNIEVEVNVRSPRKPSEDEVEVAEELPKLSYTQFKVGKKKIMNNYNTLFSTDQGRGYPAYLQVLQEIPIWLQLWGAMRLPLQIV